MDMLKAILMGVVEGVTEFLPVSSTGHLILAKQLLSFEINDSFEIFIQMGAMLAVLWLYRQRFVGLLNFKQRVGFSGGRGISLLALTTLPALVAGFLLHGVIKERLFNSLTVALGLGAGAVWILLAERGGRGQEESGIDQITWKQALAIGLFQCLALWPGMSRSACTILGALWMGLSRKAAAEYSFFAAVPLLMAAGLYDLWKNLPDLTTSDAPLFATGLIVSFLGAWVAIRWLMRLLARHTLAPFGWYRLALALVILLLWALAGQNPAA